MTKATASTSLTFCLRAPTQDELGDALAELLDEHLRPEHELHVSYAAMQVGWQDKADLRTSAGLRMVPRAPQTTLLFEYSALVVLRPR